MSYLAAHGSGLVVVLLILFTFFIYLGRWISASHPIDPDSQTLKSTKIAQGAVFALFGLLLAFTFSGAMNKFDYRRTLIIDESNALSTLYARLDLLNTDDGIHIKRELLNYIDARVKIYKSIPNLALARSYLTDSLIIEKDIWKHSVKACSNMNNTAACMLILPAANSAFDLANTKVESMEIHPPHYIFILLIIIAMISTLFLGYNIPRNKKYSKMHIIFYTLIITIIIYSIIDLEYPRLGFIKIDTFDDVLIDLRNQLASK